MARTAEVGGAAGERRGAPRRMTDAHKAALAAGREEGHAVRRYLEALEAHRPRPGRKRTAEAVARQLSQTEAALATATAVDRVQLLQRRIDLHAELEELRRQGQLDLGALEAAFVAALPGYSQRKGITYAAWREAGVPARVLRAAGLRRTGRPG